MVDLDSRKKPGAGSMPKPDIHPRPVAGERAPERDTGEGAPERKHRFQKRLTEKVEQTLQEHPDGSAPPLDRLTQGLDPAKDL